MSLYHYIYPTPETYDFYMPSDETLGTISKIVNLIAFLYLFYKAKIARGKIFNLIYF